MKVGRILVCYKECVMQDTNISAITINKNYEVIDIVLSEMSGKMCLVIIDDENDRHLFTLVGYKDYFYNLKKLRKKKLKRLGKIK